ncbi:MAG: hypothetical protein ACHQNV_09410 [Vicinamibacteria bacterium]
MNAHVVIGLLCTDAAFREKFFKNGGSGLSETLEEIPLPLSWSERQGLMALADDGQNKNSPVAKGFEQVAAVMSRVGCPNPPCPYLYYATVNPPPIPPGPGPEMAKKMAKRR